MDFVPRRPMTICRLACSTAMKYAGRRVLFLAWKRRMDASCSKDRHRLLNCQCATGWRMLIHVDQRLFMLTSGDVVWCFAALHLHSVELKKVRLYCLP